MEPLRWIVFYILIMCTAASIDSLRRLYHEKFDNYSTRYRPLHNQNHTLFVEVTFSFVAVTELDLVRQTLHSNAWVNFTWKDELLTWNPEDYDGIEFLHPHMTDIWRPRVIFLSSLEDRDVFKDNTAPLIVRSDGTVKWYPGTLFLTDCRLDLALFPFDVQTCSFRMFPNSYREHEVKFISSRSDASIMAFTENGEWYVPTSKAYVTPLDIPGDIFSMFIVEISIRRRPEFFLLNVFVPVIVLSFLNMLVFALPTESGERVSYSITCLLALTVFMSIISSLLPPSSEPLPLVSLYLGCLLGLSVLSVVTTIVLVRYDTLRNRNETEKRATSHHDDATNDTKPLSSILYVIRNSCFKYWIKDAICLTVFLLLWIFLTAGFMSKIAG